MGPPGAGKGTISKQCLDVFSLKQLSTGDLCRRHIKDRSQIGQRIDFYIKSGKLIPDDLIVQMVENWLFEVLPVCEGVILDGFPRTVAQAYALQELIKKQSAECELSVFKIEISDYEVMQRLQDRYICIDKSCQVVYSYRKESNLMPQVEGICDYCKSQLVRRKDDNFNAIEHRLKTYHTFEQCLLGFFQDMGHRIAFLNGHRPSDIVFQEVKKLIRKPLSC